MFVSLKIKQAQQRQNPSKIPSLRRVKGLCAPFFFLSGLLATPCVVLSALSGCNENDTDHLDRDQQAYPPTQKTKRMRTSFKHHQLRTMKSYFAINHNPDAKDLKQLAQKTGLTKRVLQVSRKLFPSFILSWLPHICLHPTPPPCLPHFTPALSCESSLWFFVCLVHLLLDVYPGVFSSKSS